jgi:hypothetical protein
MPLKAYRWVGEMEEIARTFADLGLPAQIPEGAASLYRFVQGTLLAPKPRNSASTVRRLKRSLRSWSLLSQRGCQKIQRAGTCSVRREYKVSRQVANFAPVPFVQLLSDVSQVFPETGQPAYLAAVSDPLHVDDYLIAFLKMRWDL